MRLTEQNGALASKSVGGIQVVYIFGVPTDTTLLENELNMLEGFFKEFNSDVPDKRGMKPSAFNAAYPIVAATVLMSFNAACGPHIEIGLGNSPGWESERRETWGCVYVLAKDGDPAKGYDSFVIWNMIRRRWHARYRVRMQKALDNPL